MKPRRRVPDHEAESVSISADRISSPKKIYRNAKHNGNRSTASGDVKVKINRSHPEGGSDKCFRPDAGDVLVGDKDASIDFEAKRIQLQGRHDGKTIATASKDVRIFGRLKRRKGE